MSWRTSANARIDLIAGGLWPVRKCRPRPIRCGTLKLANQKRPPQHRPSPLVLTPIRDPRHIPDRSIRPILHSGSRDPREMCLSAAPGIQGVGDLGYHEPFSAFLPDSARSRRPAVAFRNYLIGVIRPLLRHRQLSAHMAVSIVQRNR